MKLDILNCTTLKKKLMQHHDINTNLKYTGKLLTFSNYSFNFLVLLRLPQFDVRPSFAELFLGSAHPKFESFDHFVHFLGLHLIRVFVWAMFSIIILPPQYCHHFHHLLKRHICGLVSPGSGVWFRLGLLLA